MATTKKLDLTFEAKLDADQIKQAIKEYIEKNSGMLVDGEINILMGTVSRGYGPGEYDVHVLKGATCNLKRDDKSWR